MKTIEENMKVMYKGPWGMFRKPGMTGVVTRLNLEDGIASVRWDIPEPPSECYPVMASLFLSDLVPVETP